MNCGGTHVLTDAGPIDQNSVPGALPWCSVVAGDDTLAFLYIYHKCIGNTKHLTRTRPSQIANPPSWIMISPMLRVSRC